MATVHSHKKKSSQDTWIIWNKWNLCILVLNSKFRPLFQMPFDPLSRPSLLAMQPRYQQLWLPFSNCLWNQIRCWYFHADEQICPSVATWSCKWPLGGFGGRVVWRALLVVCYRYIKYNHWMSPLLITRMTSNLRRTMDSIVSETFDIIVRATALRTRFASRDTSQISTRRPLPLCRNDWSSCFERSVGSISRPWSNPLIRFAWDLSPIYISTWET